MSRRRRLGVGGGIAAAAALAATVWWLGRDAAAPPAGARLEASTPPAPRAQREDVVEAPAPAARTADHRILSGTPLEIEAVALDPSRPLVLALAMPDEARGTTGARSVQLLAEDGRRLFLSAPPTGPSGSGLQIQIDPTWLTPGRYLVSVETLDHSHFPVRRYAIVVR